MATITRAQVADAVHESLDTLATDFDKSAAGTRPEGDYTQPLNSTMRDCGLDDITDADTHARIRAIIVGAEFYALSRAYRRRAAEVVSQTGAGASGLHASRDPSTSLGSLRLHLTEVKERYEAALAAIGLALNVDPDSAAGLGGDAVHIDDSDDLSKALVSGDYALPWFKEGYHEVR